VPAAGSGSRPLRIGLLASQGDFAAHTEMLRGLGADPVEVRTPEQIENLDGLVIPGGESTTIAKAIERDALEPAIRAHAAAGRPILGTCAGMIICDREHLGLLDATARRNAYGRQIASFEADLEVDGIGPEPLRAVFIRAPWIESHGPEVAVLAELEGHPVAVRQGSVLATSFHPELTDDSRIHALLMAMATAARSGSVDSPAGGTKERTE
jgi:pyridoxal 5'-phosphate synthase pdxT subunit